MGILTNGNTKQSSTVLPTRLLPGRRDARYEKRLRRSLKPAIKRHSSPDHRITPTAIMRAAWPLSRASLIHRDRRSKSHGAGGVAIHFRERCTTELSS